MIVDFESRRSRFPPRLDRLARPARQLASGAEVGLLTGLHPQAYTHRPKSRPTPSRADWLEEAVECSWRQVGPFLLFLL